MKDVEPTHFQDVCGGLRENNIELPKVSIETGTHLGFTTYYMSTIFEKVYTIELLQYISDIAQKQCDDRTNIEFLVGNSPDKLKEILPTINERFLIWLDAHDSGPGTGRFPKYGADGTPLSDELLIIKEYAKYNNNIIVVDDCDSFGTANYPTRREVFNLLLDINENYKFLDLHTKRNVLVAYI